MRRRVIPHTVRLAVLILVTGIMPSGFLVACSSAHEKHSQSESASTNQTKDQKSESNDSNHSQSGSNDLVTFKQPAMHNYPGGTYDYAITN